MSISMGQLSMGQLSDMMERALSNIEPFDGHPFVLSRRLTALPQSIDVYAEVSCGNRSKPITLYGYDALFYSTPQKAISHIISRVNEAVDALRQPVVVKTKDDEWAEEFLARNPLRRIVLNEAQL